MITALYAPVEDRRPYTRRRCLREVLLCMVVLTLALLWAAVARAAAFAPARFTVVDAGTAGKPDILLIPRPEQPPAWSGTLTGRSLLPRPPRAVIVPSRSRHD